MTKTQITTENINNTIIIINTHILTALNINSLSSPIKSYRLAKWINKFLLCISCIKSILALKIKTLFAGKKNLVLINRNQKSRSNHYPNWLLRKRLQTKLIRIDKESHVILTKKTPNEGDITCPDIYALNPSAFSFIKHELLDL